MIKKFITALSLGLCLQAIPAFAIELDEATRTVTMDASGKTAVYTPEQVKRGKRLF